MSISFLPFKFWFRSIPLIIEFCSSKISGANCGLDLRFTLVFMSTICFYLGFHSYDLFCLKAGILSMCLAELFFFFYAEFVQLLIIELSSVYHSYFQIASFDEALSSIICLFPIGLIPIFLEGVSARFGFLSIMFKLLLGSGTEWIPSIDFLFLSTTLEGHSKKGVIIQIVAFPLLQVVWLPFGWVETGFLGIYFLLESLFECRTLFIPNFFRSFFWLAQGYGLRFGDLSLIFLFLQVFGHYNFCCYCA